MAQHAAITERMFDIMEGKGDVPLSNLPPAVKGLLGVGIRGFEKPDVRWEEARNSSSGIAAGSGCRPPQPTLLTSVDMPPRASAVAFATASICAASVTSQAMPRQSLPVSCAICARGGAGPAQT